MNKIAEAATALQIVLENERYAAMHSGDLLTRYVVKRDEAAFVALVGRYGRLVMRRCRDVLSREDLAQEAFQETFHQLIVNAHTVSRRGSVGPWLIATARRRAFNILRRERRQRVRDLGMGPQPNAPDVAQTVADREAGRIVSQSLSALPDRLRLPLELVYFDGMTHDEASRVLNWPKGTVDSCVRRGLIRLKKKLARAGFAASAVAAVGISGIAQAVPASWVRDVLSTASAVTPKAAGGLGTVFATVTHWLVSKQGLLVLAILGIVGGGLIVRAVIEPVVKPVPISLVHVPQRLEESLPDKNLRLLRTVVVPKICDALKPLAFGNGDVVAIETEAYDSRVRCVIEATHRQRVPSFGEKTRFAFYFDSGTRQTYMYLDKKADGAWKLVDLKKPLVLLKLPALKIEWTMKLKELDLTLAAFDDLPRDPRAEAEVAARREKLRQRLLTEYVGLWQFGDEASVVCRVKFVEPLGLSFWHPQDKVPCHQITAEQIWACEVGSRAGPADAENLFGILGVHLLDGGKSMEFDQSGLPWRRLRAGAKP